MTEGIKVTETVDAILPKEFANFCQSNNIPTRIFGVQPSRYIRLNPRFESIAADLEKLGSKKARRENEGENCNDDSAEVREGVNENSDEFVPNSGCDKDSQEVSAEFSLEEELSVGSAIVPWLPGTWWKLPTAAKVANVPSYRNGFIYGIDAASGAAALALDMCGSDVTRVLDLCCAPGAKLCLLADLNPKCQVVGVDVAENRLAVCRTILQKYQVPNAVVVRADGRNFSLDSWGVIDDLFTAERTGHGRKGRKRKREQILKDAGFGNTVPAEKNAERKIEEVTNREENGGSACSDGVDVPMATPEILFDRVIVDAECTHDGSVKHIEKFESTWGLDTLARRVPWLSESQLGDLVTLQKSLLVNGWRNLKPGGVFVYSTCSFARCQNEEVVSWFLEQSVYKSEAVLDPLPFRLEDVGAKPGIFADAFDDKGAVARFNPVDSDTSGLFLARFRKKNN